MVFKVHSKPNGVRLLQNEHNPMRIKAYSDNNDPSKLPNALYFVLIEIDEDNFLHIVLWNNTDKAYNFLLGLQCGRELKAEFFGQVEGGGERFVKWKITGEERNIIIRSNFHCLLFVNNVNQNDKEIELLRHQLISIMPSF